MGSISTNGTISATNLFIDSKQVLHAGNYYSYALPRSGGSVKGNMSINDSRVDLKQSNNGSSSTVWGNDLEFRDTHNLLSFWMQPCYYTSGQVSMTIGARNYDTSGTRVAQTDISFITKKDGTGYLYVSTNLVLNSSGYGSSLPTSSLITGRVFYKLV